MSTMTVYGIECYATGVVTFHKRLYQSRRRAEEVVDTLYEHDEQNGVSMDYSVVELRLERDEAVIMNRHAETRIANAILNFRGSDGMAEYVLRAVASGDLVLGDSWGKIAARPYLAALHVAAREPDVLAALQEAATVLAQEDEEVTDGNG